MKQESRAIAVRTARRRCK